MWFLTLLQITWDTSVLTKQDSVSKITVPSTYLSLVVLPLDTTKSPVWYWPPLVVKIVLSSGSTQPGSLPSGSIADPGTPAQVPLP